MEESIHRATDPNATISSVLNLSALGANKLRPTSSELQVVFSLLLRNSNDAGSNINAAGVVSLLILSARYFTSNHAVATEQECEYYCRCVAVQNSCLVEHRNAHIGLRDVFLAVGYAVTRIPRSIISRTGIIPALNSIALAMSEYEKGRYELTVVHAEFMQACLAAGHYRYASDFADRYPVFSISHTSSSASVDQYLRYFYYLGTIYCGCSRWSDGIKCYNICITVPSQAVSAITVASYKKLIFASLMSTSKKPIIPPGTSSVVSRFISTASEKELKQYNELADAFCSNDIGKFITRMNEMSKILQADGNYGLANILHDSIRPNIVKNVAHVFEVISLSKLAQKVGLCSSVEAEALVIYMIADGQCNAKIDQETSSVHFEQLEDEKSIDNDAMLAKIINQTRSCMDLAERVKQLDTALSTSASYQSKFYSQGKPSGQSQGQTGCDDTGDDDVFMLEGRIEGMI